MEPFKNQFNVKTAQKISKAILRSYSHFDTVSFLKGMEKGLAPLELKSRVAFLAERMHQHLPIEMKKILPILVKALKSNEKDKIGLLHFEVWPLAHFVSVYGLDEFDQSMDALKEMTKVFTSEFAVRAFFIKDHTRTLDIFNKWAMDENEHVRRLVSEGSRPLLPWGQKLIMFAENPKLTWNILEKLKLDESDYVRKSVANHINDHSKNHPDFVIDKLVNWSKGLNKNKNKIQSENIQWIIKHASRTLIKKGHPKAFVLHGVNQSVIKLLKSEIKNSKIFLGQSLKVVISIKNASKKSALVIIDHDMHLLKLNKSHSIKVFKGKKVSLNPQEIKEIEFAIPLKKVTTRVYYEGIQYWNCKINGVGQKPHSFTLKFK